MKLNLGLDTLLVGNLLVVDYSLEEALETLEEDHRNLALEEDHYSLVVVLAGIAVVVGIAVDLPSSEQEHR
jgi:hypothetical protein